MLGLTKQLPNESDGRIPDSVEQPAGLHLVERSQFAAAEAPGPRILGMRPPQTLKLLSELNFFFPLPN